MKRIVCLTFLAALSVANAQTKVFGLEIGSSYSDIAKVTKLSPSTANKNWYFTSVVPTPNKAFEDYGVSFLPLMVCVQ